jgi:hypothetical protein
MVYCGRAPALFYPQFPDETMVMIRKKGAAGGAGGKGRAKAKGAAPVAEKRSLYTKVEHHKAVWVKPTGLTFVSEGCWPLPAIV